MVLMGNNQSLFKRFPFRGTNLSTVAPASFYYAPHRERWKRAQHLYLSRRRSAQRGDLVNSSQLLPFIDHLCNCSATPDKAGIPFIIPIPFGNTEHLLAVCFPNGVRGHTFATAVSLTLDRRLATRYRDIRVSGRQLKTGAIRRKRNI